MALWRPALKERKETGKHGATKGDIWASDFTTLVVNPNRITALLVIENGKGGEAIQEQRPNLLHKTGLISPSKCKQIDTISVHQTRRPLIPTPSTLILYRSSRKKWEKYEEEKDYILLKLLMEWGEGEVMDGDRRWGARASPEKKVMTVALLYISLRYKSIDFPLGRRRPSFSFPILVEVAPCFI